MKHFPKLETCNPSICISGKIMKCNRIVSTVFRKHLKPFGITNSQLTTLFIITKSHKPSQKKISDMLYMDKSTVNRNLKRLINNGYVSKTAIHELQITTKGKSLLEDVIPHWELAMKEIKIILEQEGEAALNIIVNKLT